jgi:copper chaperone CopZ
MKTVAPIIIGIVIFAAILVGWFFTLPGTLKRATNGSYGTLTGITSEGMNFFNDIKDAQTNINTGIATMNGVMSAEYKKEAAVANLKTKIESEAKIKAALLVAPTALKPTSATKINSTKSKTAKP